MRAVATQPQLVHVTLSGDLAGEYVIEEKRPDGRLVLVPDTSAEAIRERAGLLDPTPEQAEAFWAEHEPQMLPPDDEGCQDRDGRRISASSVARVRSTPRSLRP
jgi:hypothetical protein